MRRIVPVIFIFFTVLVSGQTVRKYSNEFMNIGVDAAAFGMANAVIATTSNVNSGYWNPAGLLKITDNQLSLMHASYFANIAAYDHVGFAMPIDEQSSMAISMIRFGVDDIMNTTQLIDDQGNIDYNRISLFSTADYAVTFSYARRVKESNLTYGVNTKVIRRTIGEFADSWGVGFDAGLQYHTNNWYFGAMARDITTTFNVWSINEEKYAEIQDAVEGQNQELPETTEITLPKLQLGVARTFNIKEDFDLKTEVDLNMRFTETNDIISTSAVSISPAAGFEVAYIDMVFLRGGVGNFQNVKQLDNSENLSFQPGFGVGFKYKGISIDYAFTDIGDQSVALYSNVFSVIIDWSIFR
ncbi:MAG TPA: PorV/PorQ family protein [Salinimicrobium sp.]|nr:PorV/PorQ family protein [Salinimicrobium sp.]